MKVASPAALAGLLRSRLAETGDPLRVVTLSELLLSILPYPVARAALDLAGKAEYDLAMLGFLRRGDLVQVDPAVVAAVEREAESPEPSLAFAAGLGDSVLRLREPVVADPGLEPVVADPGLEPEPERFALIEPTELWTPEPERIEADVEPAKLVVDPPPPPAVPPPEPDAGSMGGTGEGDEASLAGPRVVTEPEPWVPDPTMAPTCWQCGEPLPDRPIVFFCTQCGVSQDNRRCTECGDRVESAWRFCGRCGTGLNSS